MTSTLGLLLFLGAVTANFAGMLALSTVLGPRRRNPVKDEPFECGSIPLQGNEGRFHVRFYMVAMLFLIFDVEVVFMYPWAMIYMGDKASMSYLFWAMAVFFTVLVLGLAYEWKRGGMDWD